MKTCTFSSPLVTLGYFFKWVFNENRPNWWQKVGQLLDNAVLIGLLSFGFLFLLAVLVGICWLIFPYPHSPFGWTYWIAVFIVAVWCFVAYCCSVWNDFIVPLFDK
jgi:hypothetical protein